MPGKLDAQMRALAKGLIKDFGKNVTLRRRVSTYDPTTGNVSNSDTDYPVTVSPPAPYSNRRIDGELIKVGDIETLLAAAGNVTPDPTTDFVVLDAELWQVVRSDPIYSGALPAAFTLQLRK